MTRIAMLMLCVATTTPAWAKDVAVCGASEGYSYFPEAGLLASKKNKDAGKWLADSLTSGRFTLAKAGDQFDLLYTDGTGAVVSATGDGGKVIFIGKTSEAITVIVNYPGEVIETYTFIKSIDGAEAIWSSNKYGTLIPKIGAYRAPCSLLNLE